MDALGALALVAWNLPNLGARRPSLSGRLRRFFQQASDAFRVFRLTHRTISAGPSGFSAERVTVVSTLSTQPPMVADDLRRQTDVFIDLAELKPKVGRDPADRPGSREVRQPPQFLPRGTIKRDDWVK